MPLTDPVADLLTRIRNAVRSHHVKVDVPASKLKLEIVKILQDEGFVGGYKVNDENGRPFLKVQLKYGPNDQPVISNLRRISQPGCRVYIGRHDIRPVLGGLGISILSTPQGVMTGRQARKLGIGGEFLCEVW
ncbi:MAG TPA: 30S ribosomal protein S8 [Terriglobales bacterium]|jgi:small subunit ribosomal protein S8|nr:30S ribosomal protein S8 [Terriglobales bacterium]